MALATYFDDIAPITVHDALAQLLGASDDGLITYTYKDAVRLAGHSCPTVAGAWLSACAGLKALYGDATPQRGAVSVALPSAENEGVTGVIGQILTLVTGAAAANGFHGLAGDHQRAFLLNYGDSAVNGIRFTRNDTRQTVEVQYDPRSVPANDDMRPLMGAVLNGLADAEQTRLFGQLWQDRVKRILLEHADDPSVIRVRAIKH